jgi:acyl-CoA synthetase (AMP-forming)/AMP-acid ligase II
MNGPRNLPERATGPSPDTVYEMFAATTCTAGHLLFLAFPSNTHREYLKSGAEFSYAQALEFVESVAAEYRVAGYASGHRVALVMGNRPEYFWHFLALNSIGVCAVPLNPDYLEHEFVHAMTIADISLAVVAGDPSVRVQAAASRVTSPVPVWRIDAGVKIPAPGRAASWAETEPLHREALVIFTSGTTSRPKGCVITNYSCLESGRSYTAVGGMLSLTMERERLYVPLPTFHMNTTVLALNAMLATRGCLVSTDRFRASTWWRELRESRATGVHYLGLIPPILLKAPPSDDDGAPTVKFGLGAGVDPAVHARFEERFGFPLVEVWGMTETSRLIANAHEPREINTRSFGRPHPPWEVLVADESGAAVPHGVEGELLVRCTGADPRSGFFSGYVNDEEATAIAWRGGWFHTGDIVTQDVSGMLCFVERRKNIIRRSGENIAAAEVEEAIMTLDMVKAAVVLGVPDALRDEEPLACVVLQGEVQPSQAAAADIVASLKGRLANHKLPGWIQFVNEIPVTPTFKVRKDLLLSGFDPNVAGSQIHDVRSLKSRRGPAV